VLEGLAAQHDREIVWTDPGGLEQALSDETALVTFSHVDYRSSAIADMRAITQAAHAAGALTLFDLSHSVGVVPIRLDDDGVDLAVGCTYKYLNGGPGSPSFLYVRAEHHEHLSQPIWGWLGRADPFAMGSGYVPGPGIARFLSGTPAVLGLVAAQVGIDYREPDVIRLGLSPLTTRFADIDLGLQTLQSVGGTLKRDRSPPSWKRVTESIPSSRTDMTNRPERSHRPSTCR
jgi:kynureninase